ncbi:MAG: sugar phosphate isomerase/epimerase [Opitutaceae bacterium]|nr:sugar phosphate isomerase/epimerase [Opitutaceae bacterium]
MKHSQIAAQLYTIRDYLKTPAEIAVSLKKIREIGYTAVQVSAMGPIAEEELNRILAGEGLTCCATHEPSDLIRKNPEKVIERLQALECGITAYPYPLDVDFSKKDDVEELIDDLNKAGEKMRRAGITLCYHNHAIEFVKVNGKTILDHIYDSIPKENLASEIDTYWVQYGGGDPIEWCRKLEGRMPIIHLKDYKFTTENKPDYAEIGYGNLDWKRLISAADQAGCHWYTVEQDTCDGDPFDSLKMSFEYIKNNLVE